MFAKSEKLFWPVDGHEKEISWEQRSIDQIGEVISNFDGDAELRVVMHIGGLAVIPAYEEYINPYDQKKCHENSLRQIARSDFWYRDSGVLIQPVCNEILGEDVSKSAKNLAYQAERLGLKVHNLADRRDIPSVGTRINQAGSPEDHQVLSLEWAYNVVRYAGFNSVIAVVDNISWSALLGRNRSNNMTGINEIGPMSQGVLLLSGVKVDVNKDLLVPTYSFFGNGNL